MPAEWYPHSRCWMAWPCRPQTWNTLTSGGYAASLDAARAAYARVARAIAEFEPVTMVARPADLAAAVEACGQSVQTLAMDLSDSWLRDTGPTFLINGQGGLAGVDWQFNGWGSDRPDYEADKAFASSLLSHLGAPAFTASFVFEGGAVHVDGEGTALVVEECVLNPNRNPGMTREDFEAHMAGYLGIEKVIWLPFGLEDDETDGHVDEVACFAAPGHVLALATADPGDGNHVRLAANLKVLEEASDAKGRRLTVNELPQPAAQYSRSGIRLSLSYVNFYPANGGLVMPAFSVPEDDAARAVLQAVFPDRRVIQVPAFDIVLGGGCIHCITQQQPAA